jgi:hypothetical protein
MGSECCQSCGKSRNKETETFATIFELEKCGKKKFKLLKSEEKDKKLREEKFDEVLYNIFRVKMNMSDDYNGADCEDISDMAKIMSDWAYYYEPYEYVRFYHGPWINGLTAYHFTCEGVKGKPLEFIITWKVYFATGHIPGVKNE